jgi:hypothetical protein
MMLVEGKITMPRIKMGFEDQPRRTDAKLVERLVDELKANRESGQPFIYEQSFPIGKIRVLVIWDDWKDRAKVALASGVTVPEGVAAGMLPYQIIPAHRKADKVTLEQCREAMLAEGASALLGPNALQLRFPTEDAAEACRKRLIKRLANSDEIWMVSREITAQDFGQVSESVAAETG